jgi:hypothetical protein
MMLDCEGQREAEQLCFLNVFGKLPADRNISTLVVALLQERSSDD